MHFSYYADAAPKAGPGDSAVLSTSRLTAKRILHHRTVRKPIATATDYVWEGMRLGNSQGVLEPHVDKLQGDRATRN